MSELSPAAQAVLDNYGRALFTKQYAESGRIEIAVAAALRAAADQVVPEHVNPVGDLHDEARQDQWIRIRCKILAIATELEAQ